MPTPFSRTLRSLHAEKSRAGLFGGLAITALAMLWGALVTNARFPVYAASAEARVEVERSAAPIQSSLGGRLTAIHAKVGLPVEAGEPLFELEVTSGKQRLEGEEISRQGLDARAVALRRVRASERRALAEGPRVVEAASAQARAQHAAASEAAQMAEREAGRAAQLHIQGLLAAAQLERLQSAARRAQLAVAEASGALTRIEAEARREQRDRRTRLEQIEEEIVQLTAEQASSTAAARVLETEIERRIIRASTAGLVAEVAELTAGSVIATGDRLATVLPRGGVQIRAGFPAGSALSRLAVGQPARLRLDGFPWTEFGTVEAKVTRVASQPRDGLVWIDCEVIEVPRALRPLRHGLPGRLFVEIERLPPAQLVLRAAGRRLSRSSARSPAAGNSG